jgi:hypothetical protein
MIPSNNLLHLMPRWLWKATLESKIELLEVLSQLGVCRG